MTPKRQIYPFGGDARGMPDSFYGGQVLFIKALGDKLRDALVYA